MRESGEESCRYERGIYYFISCRQATLRGSVGSINQFQSLEPFIPFMKHGFRVLSTLGLWLFFFEVKYSGFSPKLSAPIKVHRENGDAAVCVWFTHGQYGENHHMILIPYIQPHTLKSPPSTLQLGFDLYLFNKWQSLTCLIWPALIQSSESDSHLNRLEVGQPT